MRSAGVLVLGLWIAACGGPIGSGDSSVSDSSDPPPDGGDLPPPPDGGDLPPPPDGGPCVSGGLASRIVVIPASTSLGRAYPTDDNGAVVANGAFGGILLQGYDPAGGAIGPSIPVTGNLFWGLAANHTSYAVLVSRLDALVLVIVPRSGGAPSHEEVLYGDNTHMVAGDEWFPYNLKAGRVDWNGTSWVTYSTVQHLYPDGLAHEGDRLLSFNADGTPASTIWGWGCSHSLDVRLTHALGSGAAAAVCSSDCYPGKGVAFMANTMVFADSSGDCAGYAAQQLGGLAAIADGYLSGFVSREGRTSRDPAVAHITLTGMVGPVQWLSAASGDASFLHVVAFGTGALAAWGEGGAGYLQLLDATGSPIGAAETIDPALLGLDDFFNYTNGDVGWLGSRGLVRLPACP